jgi:hypothetical protein
MVDHRPLYRDGSLSYIYSYNLCLPSLSYNYQISFEHSFPRCSRKILGGIYCLLSTLAMASTDTLKVYSQLAAPYISTALHLDSSPIPLRSPWSPLPSVNRRSINLINRRIHTLRTHRERCLRLLPRHYSTLEAAKELKWCREYRRGAARID